MRLLLMGLVVLLAGCSTQEPEVRTVRVEVPVLVPCRAPDVCKRSIIHTFKAAI
ncbi:hypothetical protein [Pseudomonas sp. NPDC087626]|uniref:hypothetical protein n=1 Tax=Pseudomonas sp. NPDC087626 TaxID=3364444 RepID=UPI0038197A3B